VEITVCIYQPERAPAARQGPKVSTRIGASPRLAVAVVDDCLAAARNERGSRRRPGLVRIIRRKLKKIEASGLTDLEASGRGNCTDLWPCRTDLWPYRLLRPGVNVEWLPAIGGGEHDGFRSYQGILAQRKAHLLVPGNPSCADPSMDTPERAAEKRQDPACSRPGYPGDKVPSGVNVPSGVWWGNRPF
jgi:hypothetical protein